MCSASSAKCCVLPNGPTPLRERPPPPFIDTKRDGVHAQGVVEVVVFSPKRGGAVVKHCGKYTVGYGAGRGSRPGHRPWSCGDRAGVLAAPVGSVVVAVAGTVPCTRRGGVSRVLQAGVLIWSRSGLRSRVAPTPFEGSCGGKAGGKYRELAAHWLEQCRARLEQHRSFPQCRHSARDDLSSDRSWRIRPWSQLLCGVEA